MCSQSLSRLPAELSVSRPQDEDGAYFNLLFACFAEKAQEIKRTLIEKSNSFVEIRVRNRVLAILG